MPSGSLCSGTAGAHACYPQVQLDESRMLIPLDTGVTAGADLQSGFSLEAAAGALATSERTLQRSCTAVLDVEAIASEVGYDNGAKLRALLHERLGRGVQELRGDLW